MSSALTCTRMNGSTPYGTFRWRSPRKEEHVVSCMSAWPCKKSQKTLPVAAPKKPSLCSSVCSREFCGRIQVKIAGDVHRCLDGEPDIGDSGVFWGYFIQSIYETVLTNMKYGILLCSRTSRSPLQTPTKRITWPELFMHVDGKKSSISAIMTTTNSTCPQCVKGNRQDRLHKHRAGSSEHLHTTQKVTSLPGKRNKINKSRKTQKVGSVLWWSLPRESREKKRKKPGRKMIQAQKTFSSSQHTNITARKCLRGKHWTLGYRPLLARRCC